MYGPFLFISSVGVLPEKVCIAALPESHGFTTFGIPVLLILTWLLQTYRLVLRKANKTRCMSCTQLVGSKHHFHASLRPRAMNGESSKYSFGRHVLGK